MSVDREALKRSVHVAAEEVLEVLLAQRTQALDSDYLGRRTGVEEEQVRQVGSVAFGSSLGVVVGVGLQEEVLS